SPAGASAVTATPSARSPAASRNRKLPGRSSAARGNAWARNSTRTGSVTARVPLRSTLAGRRAARGPRRALLQAAGGAVAGEGAQGAGAVGDAGRGVRREGR